MIQGCINTDTGISLMPHSFTLTQIHEKSSDTNIQYHGTLSVVSLVYAVVLKNRPHEMTAIWTYFMITNQNKAHCKIEDELHHFKYKIQQEEFIPSSTQQQPKLK